VSYKKQELLILREHLNSPLIFFLFFFFFFFGGIRVAHLFSFLCCPIMCFYVHSSMLICPLRFPHKIDIDISHGCTSTAHNDIDISHGYTSTSCTNIEINHGCTSTTRDDIDIIHGCTLTTRDDINIIHGCTLTISGDIDINHGCILTTSGDIDISHGNTCFRFLNVYVLILIIIFHVNFLSSHWLRSVCQFSLSHRRG
jgi:hypothetical protein